MKIKCSYCGSFISDTDEKCPHCGAINENLKRVGVGVPTSIEELKKWYVEHNLPSEEITRFFIGKDCKEARAFGIYYDESSENYIVYKNKNTGERKIRYEGKDEKYAVNELYLRLKEEITNQKGLNNSNSNEKKIKSSSVLYAILIIIFLISIIFNFTILSFGIIIFFILSIFEPKKNEIIKFFVNIFLQFLFYGIIALVVFAVIALTPHRNDAYYEYDDKVYYNYKNDWYYYDYDYNTWDTYDGDTKDFQFISNNYDTDLGVTNFTDSDFYDDNYDNYDDDDDDLWSSSSSSSDDWDSGSSWDSDSSWDSGGTDWDSDW